MPEEIDARVVDAVIMSDRHALQSALEAGASANAKSESGSALALACLQDRSDLVSDLIRYGADVNAPGVGGATSLFTAASSGGVVIMELLLKAGANPDARNDIGQTPLMVASRTGNLSGVQTLLSCGAVPQLSDHDGRNALHWAIAGGDFPTLVDLLKKAGLSPLARNTEGDTPLDYARKLERKETLAMLADGR